MKLINLVIYEGNDNHLDLKCDTWRIYLPLSECLLFCWLYRKRVYIVTPSIDIRMGATPVTFLLDAFDIVDIKKTRAWYLK